MLAPLRGRRDPDAIIQGSHGSDHQSATTQPPPHASISINYLCRNGQAPRGGDNSRMPHSSSPTSPRQTTKLLLICRHSGSLSRRPDTKYPQPFDPISQQPLCARAPTTTRPARLETKLDCHYTLDTMSAQPTCILLPLLND